MSDTPDSPQIWHIWEDSGVLLLARVQDWDGNLLTQDACTGIAYKVFDVDDNNAVTGSGTLTIGTVVFDTEQSGGNWPHSDGYNFKTMMAATAFPTGGHRYVAEIIITPTSGQPFPLRWILHAHNLLGS